MKMKCIPPRLVTSLCLAAPLCLMEEECMCVRMKTPAHPIECLSLIPHSQATQLMNMVDTSTLKSSQLRRQKKRAREEQPIRMHARMKERHTQSQTPHSPVAHVEITQLQAEVPIIALTILHVLLLTRLTSLHSSHALPLPHDSPQHNDRIS